MKQKRFKKVISLFLIIMSFSFLNCLRTSAVPPKDIQDLETPLEENKRQL
jgi:hypothetical protein